MPQREESYEQLIQQGADVYARSGASFIVTSLTDMAAFAISSSSALPALASFCAYAAIGVFFLQFFSGTYFIAAVILDEKRQRDHKQDVLCCFKRKRDVPLGNGHEDNLLSSYFRKYHAPEILGIAWNEVGVILGFAGLFAFGIYGTLNLTVEGSQRNFIPEDSYINDYFSTGDKYYASGSTSIGVNVLFEGAEDIYDKRSSLAELETQLEGLSSKPPYFAEPDSDATYINLIFGLTT